MGYGKAIGFVGTSILLMSSVASAQTPAPAADASGSATVGASGSVDTSAATGGQTPENPKDLKRAETEIPTGTEPPVTPPPLPGTPPASAAAVPAPPAEVAKAPTTPSEPTLSKFKISIYGFVEFDVMHDSTQGFGESVGATVLPHSTATSTPYTLSHGRTHFTARNSRIGFKISAPEFAGFKTTGTLEMDFFGYQVNPPSGSEASLVSNGTFRMRQANIKAESKVIDLLFGQYYHLFGWQPFFFPATTSFFPVMNQAFGRMPQLRASHNFKSDPVNVELAVAAVKPPQRDSEVPDLQAGLRIGFNGWKGIHTLGAGGMLIDPLTIGVSGARRHFRVVPFSAGAANASGSNSVDGWGVSFDAMVPVIPATALDQPGNALTVTGSFFTGTGIADLVGVPNNVPNASLPETMPPAAFVANVDNGLVHYNASGQLETIDWRGFMVGAQYYLPPSGRFSLTGNFTQGWSPTLERSDYAGVTTAYKLSRYADGNIFCDITPSWRVGASFQYSWQKFPDNRVSTNKREELSVYMFF